MSQGCPGGRTKVDLRRSAPRRDGTLRICYVSAMRILFALVIAAAPLAARAGDDGAKLDALIHRYLDGLFHAKPHLATFMGDHRFDGALPDISPAGTQRREAELVGQQRELAALVKAGGLDADHRADAHILADGVALELLYLREIRDWEWDPRLYDSFPFYDPREIVGQRLSDIIHGTFAPEAERRKSVAAELAALPKLLADEQAALRHPRGKRRTPKVYLDEAVAANRGALAFFASDVKGFVANDKVYAAAIAALQRYQKFLEDELAPHADGDWRLGAELYGKKFPLALQTSRTPAEVLTRARAAFEDARDHLFLVCTRLHKELWPAEPLPAARAKLIQRVVDELEKDHPQPDDLVAAHARNLDALRAFIEAKNLVQLPPRDSLRVEPMPEFKRGATAAEYLAPGMLERNPDWHATYYVDPIDPKWPPDRRDLDPLRAVLWNGPFAEGWAVYGEGLLVALGWGGDRNERFRVFDLVGQMISASNTIIDIGLHSGRMSDDEAVRFMVEEGFQPRAQAERKLLRAKLDSTQLVQYFLGLDEIQALERDYRKQVGAQFDQRTFDEALIGHGTIPVELVRGYVLKP